MARGLASYLDAFRDDAVVWLPPGGAPVEAGTLRAAIAAVDPAPWAGRRVGLGALPALELAATLVFLDGLADTVMLMPLEETGEARDRRLAAAGIDHVLEGDGLGLAARLTGAPATTTPTSTATRDRATTWLLATSGTTGVPKTIAHTLATLTRNMRAGPRGDDFRWGSLYGLRRFAGLQVFLQSFLAATPLVLHDESASADATLARLADAGVNALSGTPSMWRKLSMHPAFDRLDLRQVTLGGEIVDQGVLDLLMRRFPSARITHIYASTEAGVGFVVRDGRAGFPASFLDTPPSGVALRVDDEGHLWLAPAPTSPGAEPAWLDSGDVVRLGEAGERWRFLGRANGSINVGGSKVMPEEVEAVIEELDEVAVVQVRGKRSTILGHLVEAVVVTVPGVAFDADLKKKIVAHCRARLDAYKVPASVVEAKELALNASGKLARETPA